MVEALTIVKLDDDKMDHLEVSSEESSPCKHLLGCIDWSDTLAGDTSDPEEEEFQDKVEEAHMLITIAMGKQRRT